MPNLFTNAEYMDIPFTYGLCKGSAKAECQQYRWISQSPCLPAINNFRKIICFNTFVIYLTQSHKKLSNNVYTVWDSAYRSWRTLRKQLLQSLHFQKAYYLFLRTIKDTFNIADGFLLKFCNSHLLRYQATVMRNDMNGTVVHKKIRLLVTSSVPLLVGHATCNCHSGCF